MWSQHNYNSFWHVVLIFACFYFTRQLELILWKFQHATLVLLDGFETTCFQLHRSARLELTKMFDLSCYRYKI
jgi:hypothetical protein